IFDNPQITYNEDLQKNTYAFNDQSQIMNNVHTSQQETVHRLPSPCTEVITFEKKLPHPSDKRKYIVCSDNFHYEMISCPELSEFNEQTGECEEKRKTDEDDICKQPDLCANGGQCYSTSPTEYKCTCTEMFTGDRCETPVSSCATEPCGEGAKCAALKTDDYEQDYVCICNNKKTYGLSCRETVSNPCSNSKLQQYYPYAFSSRAYVQCNGDLIYFKPCGTGLFWNQEQKICDRVETSPTKSFSIDQSSKIDTQQDQSQQQKEAVKPQELLISPIQQQKPSSVNVETVQPPTDTLIVSNINAQKPITNSNNVYQSYSETMTPSIRQKYMLQKQEKKNAYLARQQLDQTYNSRQTQNDQQRSPMYQQNLNQLPSESSVSFEDRPLYSNLNPQSTNFALPQQQSKSYSKLSNDYLNNDLASTRMRDNNAQQRQVTDYGNIQQGQFASNVLQTNSLRPNTQNDLVSSSSQQQINTNGQILNDVSNKAIDSRLMQDNNIKQGQMSSTYDVDQQRQLSNDLPQTSSTLNQYSSQPLSNGQQKQSGDASQRFISPNQRTQTFSGITTNLNQQVPSFADSASQQFNNQQQQFSNLGQKPETQTLIEASNKQQPFSSGSLSTNKQNNMRSTQTFDSFSQQQPLTIDSNRLLAAQNAQNGIESSSSQQFNNQQQQSWSQMQQAQKMSALSDKTNVQPRAPITYGSYSIIRQKVRNDIVPSARQQWSNQVQQAKPQITVLNDNTNSFSVQQQRPLNSARFIIRQNSENDVVPASTNSLNYQIKLLQSNKDKQQQQNEIQTDSVGDSENHQFWLSSNLQSQ
ncbi:unnamed protein product, partial [Didymodactylos carnosus]